jgi:predicted SAM-dependent methyltransferase
VTAVQTTSLSLEKETKGMVTPVAGQLIRVNLGCGPDAPSSWINVDGSWNAWFSNHRRIRRALELVGVIRANVGAQWTARPLVHDLTKTLPFEANSVSAIYGSHVLEHLYRAEAQTLLLECFRVLKPGGVIRMVVPDLRAMVASYFEDKGGGSRAGEVLPADLLNERLGFRNPSRPQGNVVFKIYATWKDFHSHKYMYDAESLARYLTNAGFREVQEKGYCESDIPGICEVEREDRVLNGAGVCLEGRKGL